MTDARPAQMLRSVLELWILAPSLNQVAFLEECSDLLIVNTCTCFFCWIHMFDLLLHFGWEGGHLGASQPGSGLRSSFMFFQKWGRLDDVAG